MTAQSGQSDIEPPTSASMTPECIGPLFAEGKLLDCHVDDEGQAVWDWIGGLRLTLDTARKHFHLEVRREPDEAIVAAAHKRRRGQ